MSSNKTIAKNSLFLYFRMFLTMAVGLYTSRLVLDALGVVDYGIYGLVGGIVTMFAFLNSAMASATQRYLSFDIGKNDFDRLGKTFSATLTIHFFIAIVALILAETVGLWFVNTQLNIPSERMRAANWVYQFSVFSFLLSIIQVPYNALIIARERMKIYAYVSMLETTLKLFAVFILLSSDYDKLIFYGFLSLLVSLIIRLIYQIYCRRHFPESKYNFFYDKKSYKELLSYSGWNLFGHIAAISRNQGSNVLLNIFIGPVANASYSLATMVQGIVTNFVTSFQTAVNPQIVQQYSKGNKKESLYLIYRSSKFSFFLMSLILAPLMVNLDFFIHWWLGESNTPRYAINFIRLTLIFSLIETTSAPLSSGIHATGKIKHYQLAKMLLVSLNLPLVWILLKNNFAPEVVFYVFIGVSIIFFFLRLYFLKKQTYAVLTDFYKEILPRIFLVAVVSLTFLNVFFNYLKEESNFGMLILKSVLIAFIVFCNIFILGLNKKERKFLIEFVQRR